MKLNAKTKRILVWVGAALLMVVWVAMMLLNPTKHIEDTNGPDDVSLQTITQDQIIHRSIGSVGGPAISTSTLAGDAVTISAKKFTGVYEILYDNYWLPSDFEVDLISFEVYGGNFQLVVVHEEEIVAVLEPGTFVHYRMDDIKGYVSLRLVGESAAFKITMSGYDYDMHTHE